MKEKVISNQNQNVPVWFFLYLFFSFLLKIPTFVTQFISMIQISNRKEFFKEIVKAMVKLGIAGTVIGLFKEYDLWVAVLLFLKIVHVIYVNIVKVSNKNWILLIGMLISGVGGILAEHWGVSNGYWEYHEVSRDLPLWLPFAWMLAFYFLYRIESGLIQHITNKTVSNKLIIAFWLSLIVPAVGEMITINLGVWTYYWDYQILGVPLLAFGCLVAFHMVIYLILSTVCRKYKIEDIVFS